MRPEVDKLRAEIERLKRELDGANIGMQIREKALEQAEARLAKVVEAGLAVLRVGYVGGGKMVCPSAFEQPFRDLLAALAAAQQKEA